MIKQLRKKKKRYLSCKTGKLPWDKEITFVADKFDKLATVSMVINFSHLLRSRHQSNANRRYLFTISWVIYPLIKLKIWTFCAKNINMFAWPESDIVNHLLHQVQFSKDPFIWYVKAVRIGWDKSNVTVLLQLVSVVLLGFGKTIGLTRFHHTRLR